MNLQNLIDYCRDLGLPDPLSGVSVPAPLNSDTMKSAIMVRCGLQTPLYGDPATFTNFTTHWFNTHQWTFEHLINVIQAEYSPIENVFENRKETTTYGSSNIHSGGYEDAASGTDTTTHSESDSVERTFEDYHDKTEQSFDEYHDKTEQSFEDYHDKTEHSFDQYHDKVDQTFDQYHDKNERSFDQYHDDTERTYTNYDDSTDHTYTNYKETTEMMGSHVTETRVSAYNDSTYQPSTITGETFGEDIGGSADGRKDQKSISGSHKDDRKITGSYKDGHTETGKIIDDRTETGKKTSDHTETGKRIDDRTETGSRINDRTETGKRINDRTETGSYKDETIYGHKIDVENGKMITRTYNDDKEDHVGIDTFEVFRHGNIGVTTNQQMIEAELELLRHFDIYGYISELFETDNMLMIY